MKVDVTLTVYVLIHTHKGEIYNTEISIDKGKIDDREYGIYITFGTQIFPKQNAHKPEGKYYKADGKFYILPPEDRLEIHYSGINETLKT